MVVFLTFRALLAVYFCCYTPVITVEHMKIAPIYDPAQRRPSPKPMQVDLRKAFIIGICCWVVALIVSIVGFSATHSEMSRQMMFICSYGVVIGFALLVWEHFDRFDYRRLGAD